MAPPLVPRLDILGARTLVPSPDHFAFVLTPPEAAGGAVLYTVGAPTYQEALTEAKREARRRGRGWRAQPLAAVLRAWFADPVETAVGKAPTVASLLDALQAHSA